ncbi:hypothetical protein [Candidatus Bodocaedibacter vickermanii]|uniref:Uncharacterized protein n=1 Tax=Candidatus Bodocaedibacter vickermanii TaxID=2741701 RepID=A0A7L9RSS8_9PROT|nr:hypothetical protein CPBP_00398 [Candidatus Paracaedibacteraceae bacterium 'Lake Konstanz']
MKKYLLTLSALVFALEVTCAAIGVTCPASFIEVDFILPSSPAGDPAVQEIDFDFLEKEENEPEVSPMMQEE